MTHEYFTTSFTVPQSPQQVFEAINDVRSWWTGAIDGESEKIGDTFVYTYENLHRSTQRVTELVPGKRVAWHVDDAFLSFVNDGTEWIDTDITFDIERIGDTTEVRFAHVGLVPAIECFEACSTAWAHYVGGSLRGVIEELAVA